MSVSGYTVSLGTATTSIVAPSADSQHIVLQNLEPPSDPDEYARRGYLYIVGGTVDSGFRLRGGESVSIPMIAGQAVSAVAGEEAILGVLKQD